MRRIEVRMYVDIDEKQTDSEILKIQLLNDIDYKIFGVVKRVDIIDEIEV